MRWARAGRPKPGETISGDETLIHRVGNGVLIAVVDGLGHGPEAAKAARLACEFLRENAAPDLDDLIRRCGRAIGHTRGAAATLVWIEGDNLRHVGVGNVEVASSARHGIRPFSTPGVVGRALRKTLATEHRVSAGDLIVLFTDGISARFDLAAMRQLDPEAIAAQLLSNHAKPHDDATCVVVTF